MKFLPVLILTICLCSGCDTFKGPTGPEGLQGEKGEQGPQGENAEFTILEGNLCAGDPYSWNFKTGLDLQRCIIAVHVSKGLNSTPYFFEPSWCFKLYTICILNDEMADSDDRYRIIIASEPD